MHFVYPVRENCVTCKKEFYRVGVFETKVCPKCYQYNYGPNMSNQKPTRIKRTSKVAERID